MPWFRVDDQLCASRKAIAAGNKALGLWVRAGSWSMQQLTDGNVPAAALAMLGGTRADAKALVAAGLWHATEDGYRFHEWEQWQPSKDDLEAQRAKDRERLNEWRRNRRRNAG